MLSTPDEAKGYQNHPGAQKSQEAGCPLDTQAGVHRVRCEGQQGARDTARAAGGGQGAGGKGAVRVGEVVDQRHENEQEADAEGQPGQHGHDPVNRAPRRPCQHEDRGCV